MGEQIQPIFGLGIYTAADASTILKIPYQKVSYWFRNYVRGKFEENTDYKYYFESEKITAVSFNTLIEIFVFDFFRRNNISTRDIIISHQELAKLLNTPYPFCHTDILLSSGNSILFNYNSRLFEAKPGFQQAILEYIQPYSKKIEFSNQMAFKFYPLGKQKSIVVNPNNQFGNPIIEGSNIRVKTISSLINANESYEVIKRLYDITDTQLADVIEFLDAA